MIISNLGFLGQEVIPYNFENALDFDGTDDYLQHASFTLADTANSMSFWFKMDAFGGVIFSSSSAAGGGSYLKILSSTVIQWSVNGTGGNWTVPTMSTGTWYHVLTTITTNTGKVYLNGVESSSGGLTIGSGGWTIVYWGKDWNNTSWLNGKLDDVALWDSASATEQNAIDIYNSGNGRSPVSAKSLPDIWFKFNESGSATTAVTEGDLSTFWNGTLHDFPTSGMWVAH
jgi:hypothetical protein